ncbi:class I SAM-dependent methyltransferase [Actinopolymorpha alba]|uniref:class I SAM-dependent methyltransferase n=1 Tax=Actinopolymorpha alba TaxID=533267 RepID=UPI00037B48A9|nr:class I SAM-dependent methyltransferase [Actinopolymorpha alba]
MKTVKDVAQKRFRMPSMEGRTARWYAQIRGTAIQREVYRRQAAEFGANLPTGADILEVAPGPGFFAIELARLGSFRVTGLDISRSFVDIASENARQAGVSVDFQHGTVESMPFGSESFDVIVCQAAFKNFIRPIKALDEMHRVLRPGGTAVIQDMNHESSGAAIDEEVARMGLSPLNAFMTRRSLGMLRLRALSSAQFEGLAADSAFRTCSVQAEGIGLEVRLQKPAAS